MKNLALSFSKFVSEGSHYEIGKSIGEALSKHKALYKINVMDEASDSRAVAQKRLLLDEFCPGIFDEISGIADGLNLPVERLAVLSDFSVTGGCSQFVAMPKITSGGSVLVGRSYEFSIDDELCLCVTRASGKPAHIGFSLFLSGRFDGMNEHGLVATMSSCEYNQRSSGEGLWFPLVLRSLLDNCKNTDEAKDLLKSYP